MGSSKWYKTISVLFALVFVFSAVWTAAASPAAMAGENKEAKEVVEGRHNPDISTTNSVSRARLMRLSAFEAEEPVVRHVDAGWSEGDCEDYDWGETAFNTIQEAVDAASPGDTIIVHEGTYIENVIVDKENLTIAGDNEPTVSTDTLGGNAFTLAVPGTTIRGFDIEADGSGIYFEYDTDAEYGATSAAIINNQISAGEDGLYINKITGDLEITDNYITSYDNGIYIDVIVGASLDMSGNEVRGCGDCGIYLYSMNYTDLSFNDNTIEGNASDGFYIYYMVRMRIMMAVIIPVLII
jgi:nitrous oxidase accessory protein NosD